MSSAYSNQITRKFIDNLKTRGIHWLETNIASNEKLMMSSHDDMKTRYEMHVAAMKKALNELLAQDI